MTILQPIKRQMASIKRKFIGKVSNLNNIACGINIAINIIPIKFSGGIMKKSWVEIRNGHFIWANSVEIEVYQKEMDKNNLKEAKRGVN